MRKKQYNTSCKIAVEPALARQIRAAGKLNGGISEVVRKELLIPLRSESFEDVPVIKTRKFVNARLDKNLRAMLEKEATHRSVTVMAVIRRKLRMKFGSK